MADLSTQVLSNDGTALTFDTPGVSDTAEVGSGRNTFLLVKNDSASSTTVTIESDIVLGSGDDYPSKAVAVAAGAVTAIPLIKDYLDVDVPGRATFSVTPTASVGVAVVRR